MKSDEGELRVRPRAKTTVSLSIPDDVLESLSRVAAEKDMSVEALMKLYIGEGLRDDLDALYTHQVLDTAANVLSRRLESEEEVSSILNEIREESARYK